MTDLESAEYFEKREAEEREAAEQATTEVARKIHLAMADEYAEKANNKRSRPTLGIKVA